MPGKARPASDEPPTTRALLPCEDRTPWRGEALSAVRDGTPCRGRWTRHERAPDIVRHGIRVHMWRCVNCGHVRPWGNEV